MYTEMVEQIPVRYIEFTEEIISFISESLETSLDANIYIALTDHIYFAVQRNKTNCNISAIMGSDMQVFYPEEYKVAECVVDKINTFFHVKLGIDEIAFITMHIINAELNETNSSNSLMTLEIMGNILRVIEKELSVSLKKNSLKYQRLLIHIKFLVNRLISKDQILINEVKYVEKELKNTIFYEISLKVKQMLDKEYQLNLTNSELIYLAIHLTRLKQ